MTAPLAELWEWIDPDGNVFPFNAINGAIAGQSTNFWMPPTRRLSQPIPGRVGTYTLDSSYRERVGGLQVVFDARTLYPSSRDVSVETVLAAWAARFNVLRGAGQLRHTRLDGTRRVLHCEYDDGFGVSQIDGVWRQGVQMAVLQFYAADPVWYDDADTTAAFTTAAGGSFFPMPNVGTGSFITLVGSTVFGNATIINTGDVPIYPVWTITGPGTLVTLRNVTTGEVLALTANGGITLTAGQILTVDTRVGSTKVQLADGTNEAGYLSDASLLWTVGRGTQVLRVEMSGSTVASSVSLAYRKGFLVP